MSAPVRLLRPCRTCTAETNSMWCNRMPEHRLAKVLAASPHEPQDGACELAADCSKVASARDLRVTSMHRIPDRCSLRERGRVLSPRPKHKGRRVVRAGGVAGAREDQARLRPARIACIWGGLLRALSAGGGVQTAIRQVPGKLRESRANVAPGLRGGRPVPANLWATPARSAIDFGFGQSLAETDDSPAVVAMRCRDSLVGYLSGGGRSRRMANATRTHIRIQAFTNTLSYRFIYVHKQVHVHAHEHVHVHVHVHVHIHVHVQIYA